jgi:hypothetical protein
VAIPAVVKQLGVLFSVVKKTKKKELGVLFLSFSLFVKKEKPVHHPYMASERARELYMGLARRRLSFCSRQAGRQW